MEIKQARDDAKQRKSLCSDDSDTTDSSDAIIARAEPKPLMWELHVRDAFIRQDVSLSGTMPLYPGCVRVVQLLADAHGFERPPRREIEGAARHLRVASDKVSVPGVIAIIKALLEVIYDGMDMS